MRSEIKPNGSKRLSFIEEARRKQIVETAIQTIAHRGFSQASLAEIARKAGISKGVISYHFNGKQELIEEILACLLREPAAFIKERVGREESALGRLRAYVSANFDFMKEHRDGYVALVDLWGSHGVTGDRRRFSADAYEPSRRYLRRILEEGQKSGEFRKFPVDVAASLIQASIDGIMLQWVFDPVTIDLEASSAEVVEMASVYVLAPRRGRS